VNPAGSPRTSCRSLGHEEMNMMSETNKTILDLIFAHGDASCASESITTYLQTFPTDAKKNSEFVERVVDALLKLSHGKLDKLNEAIQIGDFRDILVAARFANSTSVHKDWEKYTIAKRTKNTKKAQPTNPPYSSPAAGSKR